MNNQHLLQHLVATNLEVVSAPQIIEPLCHDWRRRYFGQALAVVYPHNVAEVQLLVKWCQAYQVAIVCQGGNTSTCGAATPLANYSHPQLILNLARMNQVLAIDTVNNAILVEAGCNLAQVQALARDHQRYFPLNLASQASCQIGGNLATNAGGINVLKYGMMRDLTLGLAAVLADGSYLNQLHSLRKNNCYLDLKQLLIGSEGTLGVITSCWLKLFPAVSDYFTCTVGVDSIEQATCLLMQLQLYFKDSVCACEIISAATLELHRHYCGANPWSLNTPWQLLIELELNQGELNLDRLGLALTSVHLDLKHVLIASNQAERQQLWALREELPLAEKQHGYAVKHDISLPISQLQAFLNCNMPKLQRQIKNGYFSIFGHLGDGNLHYNFGLVGASAEEVAELEQIISPLVYADVVAHGGSIAAEHGIGQTKITDLKRSCDPVSYQLLYQIKQLLDPHHLFNPGKIFGLNS